MGCGVGLLPVPTGGHLRCQVVPLSDESKKCWSQTSHVPHGASSPSLLLCVCCPCCNCALLAWFCKICCPTTPSAYNASPISCLSRSFFRACSCSYARASAAALMLARRSSSAARACAARSRPPEPAVLVPPAPPGRWRSETGLRHC